MEDEVIELYNRQDNLWNRVLLAAEQHGSDSQQRKDAFDEWTVAMTAYIRCGEVMPHHLQEFKAWKIANGL